MGYNIFMDLINKLFRVVSIVLLFIFVLSLLIHTNINLDQDLGRHIKTGEIIWQTRSIPKTNLFSYANTDFPFINHHWGSEVVFYLLYKYFGILSISYIKIAIIFLAVLTVFYISLKISTLPISLISLTIFLPLLASRTDERPEIFGFLFFALFLAIFIKFKQDGYKGRAIWFLPFVQLLWTNMHITFIYGFLLIFLFLIDAFLNNGISSQNADANKIHWRSMSKSLLKHNGSDPAQGGMTAESVSPWILRAGAFKNLASIAILSLFLSLINPNGLSGLLYPLNVFKNYGYTIVENQNLFFLSGLTSNIFITIFWIQTAIITIVSLVSLFLSLKNKSLQKDFFYMLFAACYLLLSILMLRNFPFFAFTGVICLSFFIHNILKNLQLKTYNLELISNLFLIFALSFFIFLVISNTFYNTFDLNKKFELRVESSYEKAVDFFIDNRLPGPVFNNFDIGGYLDYRLFELCEERGFEASWHPRVTKVWRGAACARRHVQAQLINKIFIDNRPEAYPIKFFEEYKNAQLYPEQMNKLINKYKINSIIFSHTDGTDWGSSFVKAIKENKDYRIVYADSSTFIAVKNNLTNLPEDKKENFEKLVNETDDYLKLLQTARLLNTWSLPDLSFKTLEKAYQKNPKSCGTRLSYGSFLTQQENLFIKNQGISILKSTWICPFPKNIKDQINKL